MQSTPRCARCRLDDYRRGQRVTRRVWWTLSGAGFVMVLAVAFRANHVQGLALTALAIVIVIMAFVYQRILRRH